MDVGVSEVFCSGIVLATRATMLTFICACRSYAPPYLLITTGGSEKYFKLLQKVFLRLLFMT